MKNSAGTTEDIVINVDNLGDWHGMSEIQKSSSLFIRKRKTFCSTDCLGERGGLEGSSDFRHVGT